MEKKVQVFHFHNGSGGGVLSVIRNLLQFSRNENIENHVIYLINHERKNSFEFSKSFGASTEQVFYFSSRWNFYYTCKQLSKLIPNDDALIVAHDWLELGMASYLGMRNKVVFFLHGNFDYYFALAKNHAHVIDHFTCISKPIYDKLNHCLRNRKNDILLKYFPVPRVKAIEVKSPVLNIYYGVRSLQDERKQFLLLPKIDVILQKAGVTVNWTVVGQGGEEHSIKLALKTLQNLNYHPQLKNEEVIKQLCNHHLFVLPSCNEGLPVALVEAMKAGLVPLISNWENATSELVVMGESGIYNRIGDAEGYATAIMELNDDRVLLHKMSEKAIVNANRLFDPFDNTVAIEEIFFEAFYKEKRIKRAKKTFGSRLDHPLIPNLVVTPVRRLLERKKGR
jgi:glycosyltransferase involved in cell wall biosynthesis